jgi:tetratricopeptide (TPR) repeat protein
MFARSLSAIALLAALAAPLGLGAQAPRPDSSAAIQVQLGDLLFAEARYDEARDAYRRAVGASDGRLAERAGAGVVLSLLRTAEFQAAAAEARSLRTGQPSSALMAAVYGDALWAAGLFDEAEVAYEEAARIDPLQPRARHGRGRALAAVNRFDGAVADLQEALRLDPRQAEFHHTLAAVYERMHRFDEAAASLASYVNLLPNRERSEKAAWARAEIRFLESFEGRRPFQTSDPPPGGVWTVPIRIDRDKVWVRGKVNGGHQDFVLDTGAEQTVISRDVARRRAIAPITYMQSAGVGQVGLRGLQVGRIDELEIGSLRVRNVPCLIKNPPLAGLPSREPESFSPLALGLSMRIDYERRQLLMGRTLPPATYSHELPMRMHRLAMVRGTINGSLPATFIVDTGGEVISISDAAAGLIEPATPFRRIPLKVYGTSGWDKDAFLMPNVDLEFNRIRFTGIPVVVLNLRAPSTLLGLQLGGIVGHRFLSKYRVTIDMERAVVGLEGMVDGR